MFLGAAPLQEDEGVWWEDEGVAYRQVGSADGWLSLSSMEFQHALARL